MRYWHEQGQRHRPGQRRRSTWESQGGVPRFRTIRVRCPFRFRLSPGLGLSLILLLSSTPQPSECAYRQVLAKPPDRDRRSPVPPRSAPLVRPTTILAKRCR